MASFGRTSVVARDYSCPPKAELKPDTPVYAALNQEGAGVIKRLILALGTCFALFGVVPVLGAFFSGLSPPVTILDQAALFSYIVATAAAMAIVVVLFVRRPAERLDELLQNQQRETAAYYLTANNYAGWFRGTGVRLKAHALRARFRPTVVPSA